MSFLSLSAQDLAMDLGTSNTLVYKKSKGIILNEPTRVAIDINNGQIVGLGQGAKAMEGKTPSNIMVFSALEDGVIRDYDITRTLIKYLLDKSVTGFYFLSPRLVVSVPSGITDVEKRAVEDACIQAGARDALLIEESLATAAGAREDWRDPKANMVINMGGGLTEIGLVSMGRLVASKTIKFGGQAINRAIKDYIEENHDLVIGWETAEEIKLSLASLLDREARSMEVNGRSLKTGLPASSIVEDGEIIPLIMSDLEKVLNGLMEVLEKTPPELTKTLMAKGILLTGGTSKIRGLDAFLREKTGLNIVRDDKPMTSTVFGAGEFISMYDEEKKSRMIKHKTRW